MWKSVPCKEPLNLPVILLGGQSFRWARVEDSETSEYFEGVALGVAWRLRYEQGLLHYMVLGEVPANQNGSPKNHVSLLEDYFQLNLDTTPLVAHWCKVDEKVKELAPKFWGLRILNQDPTECLFSFICSANNNIPRISSLVQKLAIHFGQKIPLFQDSPSTEFYAFPSIEALAKIPDLESQLRKLGFGYRAKYIAETAQKLLDLGGESWLLELRNKPYLEARLALQTLSGIGAKVADCICLMSLSHAQAVPIDTHVLQVTRSLYGSQLSLTKAPKTLTTKMYNDIGDFYRARFGDYAGWAHDILFCADLKQFKETSVGSKKEGEMKKEEEKISSKKRAKLT